MTKLEALKAAQEYVDGLMAEKNASGYPKYQHFSVESRIAQTLNVAKFLYEQDEED